MLKEHMEIEMKLNGREKIEGKTAKEIVEIMSTFQWRAENEETPGDLREYMQTVSKRIRTAKGGKSVRACCADHFLEDLAVHDVIKRIS